MKGKLDEACQYECHTGQLLTKPPVNPKNYSKNISMPFFANGNDDILSEIPHNIDRCGGREDTNVISKLRNGKKLSDP